MVDKRRYIYIYNELTDLLDKNLDCDVSKISILVVVMYKGNGRPVNEYTVSTIYDNL